VFWPTTSSRAGHSCARAHLCSAIRGNFFPTADRRPSPGPPRTQVDPVGGMTDRARARLLWGLLMLLIGIAWRFT
jgi:hypothetical protein